MARTAVTVCGAGALGANITEGLARIGFERLRVIDRDRVEERNLSTQPYGRADIGARKATILANGLYRALAVEVDGQARELTAANAAKLVKGSDLVIDAFDNSVARAAVGAACRQSDTPCLHVGLAADFAALLWDEVYRVPSAAQDDVCDYPLARNVALLAATVACELAVEQATGGHRRSFTITRGDLQIRPFAG